MFFERSLSFFREPIRDDDDDDYEYDDDDDDVADACSSGSR